MQKNGFVIRREIFLDVARHCEPTTVIH